MAAEKKEDADPAGNEPVIYYAESEVDTVKPQRMSRGGDDDDGQAELALAREKIPKTGGWGLVDAWVSG